MIKRVILIVLDSVGAGELPDSAKYGDSGADTLGHIFKFFGGDFSLPNMEKLGLYKILNLKSAVSDKDILGCYGKMATKSPAKDTTAGHWELAGIILKKPLPVFNTGFPKELIEAYEKKIGIKTLGNCAASGTEIINRLGDEHVKTGFPIIYTSADSVFQIAAHEEKFGLEKLYKISQIARDFLTGDYALGRVIARPFIGENGSYSRTQNRKDFSLDPFEETVLDILKEHNGEVVAIGKIEDIFNHRGITKTLHTRNNTQGMQATLDEVLKKNDKNSLIFVNLVDFDMLWGHRRDIVSYANGLKAFDDFLPQLINTMNEEDMLMITADHGCDPSFTAHTDHTREYVPLLIYGKTLQAGIDLGIREQLSDIAQTVSDIFSLPKMKNGKSFKNDILEANK